MRPPDPPASIAPLRDYGISDRHGFAAHDDPPLRLPTAYARWDDALAELPLAIMRRRVRRLLGALPELDPRELADTADRERALLGTAMLAMAWVWGDDAPAASIPPHLARPLVTLAGTMDRVPIVTHANMVLVNWRRLRTDAPLSMDNVDLPTVFEGGLDEKWFFLSALGFELAGAPTLPVLVAAVDAAARGDDDALARALHAIALGVRAVERAAEATRDACDPHVFFHKVRRWFTGFAPPGMVYEGTDLAPQVLAGGSAAQSALIQAFDCALGVRHDAPASSAFLVSMRRAMQPGHRRFLADLERASRVRERAAAAPTGAPVREAHDTAIAALAQLRRAHMRLANDYVTRPARAVSGAAEPTGTGGTHFMSLLAETRDATLAASTRPARRAPPAERATSGAPPAEPAT